MHVNDPPSAGRLLQDHGLSGDPRLRLAFGLRANRAFRGDPGKVSAAAAAATAQRFRRYFGEGCVGRQMMGRVSRPRMLGAAGLEDQDRVGTDWPLWICRRPSGPRERHPRQSRPPRPERDARPSVQGWNGIMSRQAGARRRPGPFWRDRASTRPFQPGESL